VNTGGGTPTIDLNSSAATNEAVYSAGSGTTTLTFNYTVAAGDSSADLDYVATTSLVLNGGTIQDAALNNATLTLPAIGAVNSLGFQKALVIDAVPPTITNVTSSTLDGTYGSASVVAVNVTFSEIVTVNTGGGTPTIDLNSSAATNEAVYSAGSGTNTLTFNYTVVAGDSSADLDYVATTSLVLNGGTIQDAALNNATLTLPAIGAANSLGFQKALVIDAVSPTITNVTSSTLDGTYAPGFVVAINVTFSEIVTVNTGGGTPTIDLNSSAATNEAVYAAGSGTTTLTFNYTVVAGDSSADLDYVATTSLVLNGGTIQDAALNNATLTLPALGAANSLGFQKALVIDGVSPIAHFPFDFGNLADDVINAVASTVNGGVALGLDRHAIATNAYSFAGVAADYITLPNYAVIDLNYPISFSAWVKPDTSVDNNILFTDVWQNGYQLQVKLGGTVNCGFGDGVTIRNFVTTDTVSSGRWHHIACTIIDANTIQVYIDGKLAVGGAYSGTGTVPAFTASQGTVGGEVAGVNLFKGEIDDIKVYSYARTAADVQVDYNTKKWKGVLTSVNGVTGLVAGDGVNWSDPNNWYPAGVPAGDDVVLDHSYVAGIYSVTIPVGITTIGNFELNDGGTAITVSTTGANLIVNNHFDVLSGTINGGGTITLAGSTDGPFRFTAPGATMAVNFIVDTNNLVDATGTKSYQLQSAASINGALSVNNGTLDTSPDAGVTSKPLVVSGSVNVGDGSGGGSTANLKLNGSAVNVGGSWTNSADGFLAAGTSTVTFDAVTAGNTITTGSAAPPPFYNVIFDGVGGGWTIATNPLFVDGDITINNGSVSAAVTVRARRNWTSNPGTFSSTGFVIFEGTADNVSTLYTINCADTLNNVNINGLETLANLDTYQLAADLSMSGTLQITDGYLDTSATNYQLSVNHLTIGNGAATTAAVQPEATLTANNSLVNVTGNWNVNALDGAYIAGGSTVTLNGTAAQMITGGTTFNNLTLADTGARTITFPAGVTTSVDGVFTANGALNGLTLVSSAVGTQTMIYLSATGSITAGATNLALQDHVIYGPGLLAYVNPTLSANNGNNEGWFTPLDVYVTTAAATPAGSDTLGTGSKARPFLTPQKGVNMVVCTPGPCVGNKVHIASGLYQVDYSTGTHITMKEGVSLRGGYDVADNTWITWDPLLYVTTIEDIAASGGVLGTPATPVYVGSGITSGTSIEGITFQGSLNAASVYSTGIHVFQSSPTMVRNKIFGGSGSSESYGIYIDGAGAAAAPVVGTAGNGNAEVNGGSGGSTFGIYVTGALANPAITENGLINGGAASETLAVAVSAGVIITGSASASITNNALIDGGTTNSAFVNSNSYGVRLDGATLTLTGNTIYGGVSQKNSYAFVSGGGTSTVSGNRLYGGTGGVFSVGVSIEGAATGTIYNNAVHGGDSLSGSIGIQAWGAAVNFYNNTVYSGSAPTAWSVRLGGSTTGSNIKNNILFCDGAGTEYGVAENDINSEPATLQNNDIYTCATALYFDEFASARTTVPEINNATLTAQLGTVSGNISQPVDLTDFGGVDANPATWNGDALQEWSISITKPAHANVVHGGLDGNTAGWGFNTDISGVLNARTIGLNGVIPANNGGAGWSMGAYEYTAANLGNKVYVDNNGGVGSDNNSGLDPTLPLKTLPHAYNDTAIPGFIEVSVAGSAISYDVDSSLGASSTNISLKEGISLKGGYDTGAGFTTRTLGSSIITDLATGGGGTILVPRAAIYGGAGITNATLIDGFTINGDTSGAAAYSSGIHIDGTGSPVIQNNSIICGISTNWSVGIMLNGSGSVGISTNTIDCSATLTGQFTIGVVADGGTPVIDSNTITAGGGATGSLAIHVDNSGTNPTISNNTLNGGTSAGSAEGIRMWSTGGGPTATIFGNTINAGGNALGTTSAGIHIISTAAGIKIYNNPTINGGTSPDSRGIWLAGGGTATIDDNAGGSTGNNIDGGSGANDSYGIYIDSPGTTSTISNNVVISGGSSGNASYGIIVFGGTPVISNNPDINGGAGGSFTRAISSDSADAIPTISGNTIAGGNGTSNSRGVEVKFGSAAIITGNSSIDGGSGANSYGIKIETGSVPVIQSNTLISGGSGTLSYGIHIEDIVSALPTTALIGGAGLGNTEINGGTGGATSGIFVTGSKANPTIANNTTITGGAASSLTPSQGNTDGVRIEAGAQATIQNNGTIYSGTTITAGSVANGIQLNASGLVAIFGNLVVAQSAPLYTHGILNIANSSADIYQNRVYGGSGTTTSVGVSCDQSIGNIYNNVIHGGSSATESRGYQTFTNSNCLVDNNTVYSGDVAGTRHVVYIANNTQGNVRNNILFCPGTGVEYGIFELDGSSDLSLIKNNDIYGCSTLYRDEGVTNITSINVIESSNVTFAAGGATGNISQPVDFVNFTGLDGNAALWDADNSQIWAPSATAAMPAYANVAHGGLNLSPTITTDYSGAPRNTGLDATIPATNFGATGWTIGAYEFDDLTGILGNVVYVSNTLNPNGDILNSGLNPTHPVETLNRGYNEIAIPGMTEVRVAAGTYTVDSGTAGTNIKMKPGISLIGGYNAAFSVLDFVNNVTVISDQVTGVDGSSLINPYRAIEFNGNTLTSATTLDGFTIQGNQVAGTYLYSSGVAILNGAQPAVYNNIIDGGIATGTGASMGIIIYDPSTTVYSQAVIGASGKGNREINGGTGGNNAYGIFAYGAGPQPLIQFNTLIDGGSPVSSARGIHLGTGNSTRLPVAVIQNNTSIKGGSPSGASHSSYGISITAYSGASISFNTIDGNTLSSNGSNYGVYITQGAAGITPAVSINDNTIRGGLDGTTTTGIYTSGASAKPTIGPNNSIYGGNGKIASTINASTGIYVNSGSQPVITGNTIIRGSNTGLTGVAPATYPQYSKAILVYQTGYTSTAGVQITSNLIEGGDATSTAYGIHLYNVQTQQVNHVIQNNSITGGNNGGGGGCSSGFGIYMYDYASSPSAVTVIGDTSPNSLISGGVCNSTYGLYITGSKASPLVANNTLITAGSPKTSGYGVRVSSSFPTIQGNTIKGGDGLSGAISTRAIYTNNGAPLIKGNYIDGQGGGTVSTSSGIDISGGDPVIDGNRIIGGSGSSSTYGVNNFGPGNPLVINNLIYSGLTGSTYGVRAYGSQTLKAYNNTIYANSPVAGSFANGFYLGSTTLSLYADNNIVFCSTGSTFSTGIYEVNSSSPVSVQNNNLFNCTYFYNDSNGNGYLTTLTDLNNQAKTGAGYSSGNISVDLNLAPPAYARFSGFSGTEAGFAAESWAIVSDHGVFPPNLIEGGRDLTASGVTSDFTGIVNVRTTALSHSPSLPGAGGLTLGAHELNPATTVKVAITSAPQSINPGVCSGAVTFQTQTQTGALYSVPVDTVFSVTADSPTMTFYGDAGCSLVPNTTILAGNSGGTIFFKDTASGNPVVTISNPYYKDAQQSEIIQGVIPKIKVIAIGDTVTEGGTDSVVFTAYSVDPSDLVTPITVSSDVTVTLTGALPSAELSPTSPSIIIPGGSNQGSLTITAQDDLVSELKKTVSITGFNNSKGLLQVPFAGLTINVIDNDRKGPTVTSVEYYDIDPDGTGPLTPNGHIDHVKIRFSEPVNDATFDPVAWNIAGYNGIAYVAPVGVQGPDGTYDVVNDSTLWLSFTESIYLDTGATPDLTATNSTLVDNDPLPCPLYTDESDTITTNDCNLTTGGFGTLDVVEADKAPPVLSHALYTTLPGPPVTHLVLLSFSEAIGSSTTLCDPALTASYLGYNDLNATNPPATVLSFFAYNTPASCTNPIFEISGVPDTGVGGDQVFLTAGKSSSGSFSGVATDAFYDANLNPAIISSSEMNASFISLAARLLTAPAAPVEIELASGVKVTATAAAPTIYPLAGPYLAGSKYSFKINQHPGEVCAPVQLPYGTLIASPTIIDIQCVPGYADHQSVRATDPAVSPETPTDIVNSTYFGFVLLPAGVIKSGNKLYVGSGGSILQGTLPGPPASYTVFSSPPGAAALASFVSDGVNIYAGDYSKHCLFKIDPAGSAITIAGLCGTPGNVDNADPTLARFNTINGMAIDDEYLYISDRINQKIRRYNLSNGVVDTLVTFGAECSPPVGIALVDDWIYTACLNNHTLVKVNKLTGVSSLYAGTPGQSGIIDGDLLLAKFASPNSISSDGKNLYVTSFDGAANSLRKIDIANGVVSSLIVKNGNVPSAAGSADFQTYAVAQSSGIYADGADIYMTQQNNSLVRKISSGLATYHKLAGDPKNYSGKTDATGNTADGTLSGSGTSWTESAHGRTNDAISLDGINGNVIVPHRTGVTDINADLDDFTVSFWIKLPSDQSDFSDTLLGGAMNAIVSTFNGVNVFPFEVGVINSLNASSGRLYVIFTENATPFFVTVPVLVNDNKFHHVAMRFTQSLARYEFTIDGVSYLTAAVNTAKTNNTALNGIGIGSRTNGAAKLKGVLSDVRVYRRGISNAEIKRLAARVPDGLTAYFPLDGDSSDYTVYSRAMTVSGAPSSTASDRYGVASRAYHFNGSTDKIVSTDTSGLGLPLNDNNRTMCSWFKPEKMNDGNWYGLVTYGDATVNGNGFGLALNTLGEVDTWLFGNPTTYDLLGQRAAPSDWQHWCASYDKNSQTMKMYVDGRLQSEGTRSIVTSKPSALFLGQFPNYLAANWYRGSLDDVRIYNRVLSENEVRALADKPFNPTEGLVAWYPLDDGPNVQVIKDRSGNGIDGIPVNNGVTGAPLLTSIGPHGKPDSALYFNGGLTYISLPASPQLPQGNSARTMCAWHRSEGIGGLDVILAYGNPLPSQASGLALAFDRYQMSGWSNDVDFLATPATNSWIHICGVMDSQQNGTLYINGKLVSGPVLKSTWATGNSGFIIGAQVNGTDSFKGAIADVRIYNRPLSVLEIGRLATQVPDGIAAYYPFSDAVAIPAVGTTTQDMATGSYSTAWNGADGTTKGTPDRYGLFESAYSFDGVNDSILTSDNNLPGRLPADPPGSGNKPRTQCAWFKPLATSNAGVDRIAVAYGSYITVPPEASALFIRNSGAATPDGFGFAGWGSDLDTNINSLTLMNVWTHICGVYVNGNIDIYANGRLVQSSPATPWDTVLNGNFTIGGIAGGYYQGVLDDVRIYRRVLNPDEIRALAGYNPMQVTTWNSVPASSGLLVHYAAETAKCGGLLCANGGAVDAWSDTSGLVNDVAAATTPTYVASSIGQRPGIQFTAGSGQAFGRATMNGTLSSSNYTFFVVGQRSALGSNSLLAFQNSVLTGGLLGGFNLSDKFNAYGYSIGGSHTSTGVFGTASPYMITDEYDSLDFFIRSSGGFDSSLGSAGINTFNMNGIAIGNNTSGWSSYGGIMSEVLLFNGSLTANPGVYAGYTDRDIVECYLSAKYNLPVAHRCP